jgi:hypothetical protein
LDHVIRKETFIAFDHIPALRTGQQKLFKYNFANTSLASNFADFIVVRANGGKIIKELGRGSQNGNDCAGFAGSPTVAITTKLLGDLFAQHHATNVRSARRLFLSRMIETAAC